MPFASLLCLAVITCGQRAERVRVNVKSLRLVGTSSARDRTRDNAYHELALAESLNQPDRRGAAVLLLADDYVMGCLFYPVGLENPEPESASAYYARTLAEVRAGRISAMRESLLTDLGFLFDGDSTSSARAETLVAAGLDLSRRRGNRKEEGRATFYLGVLRFDRHEYAEARQCFRDARPLLKDAFLTSRDDYFAALTDTLLEAEKRLSPAEWDRLASARHGVASAERRDRSAWVIEAPDESQYPRKRTHR
jgi:hypothetical protein